MNRLFFIVVLITCLLSNALGLVFLQGTIDSKYKIAMCLVSKKNPVGFYFYNKNRIPILVNGYISESGQIKLGEYVEIGNRNADFAGTFSEDKFKGTWIYKTKEMSFSLDVVDEKSFYKLFPDLVTDLPNKAVYAYGGGSSRSGSLDFSMEKGGRFYLDLSRGPPSYNMGSMDGFSKVKNNYIEYSYNDFGYCKMFIFVFKTHSIVAQDGDECGFGHAVYGTGIYKKISNDPKFDIPQY